LKAQHEVNPVQANRLHLEEHNSFITPGSSAVFAMGGITWGNDLPGIYAFSVHSSQICNGVNQDKAENLW